MRVMVIDDDATILEISKRILTNEGHDVVAVSNGEEGIEILKRSGCGIDLVVLDWALPGLSGSETFRAIKLLNREFPVLICSGQSIDWSAIKMNQNTNVAYLTKPFRTEDLLAAINEVIGN